MTKPKKKPISRQGRYSEYQRFMDSIPPRSMSKRPKYLHGIGVFRGLKGDTAWVKIRLPYGTIYQGKAYSPNQPLEIKLGRFESFTWEQLEEIYNELQGKADRDEQLEKAKTPLFSEYADQWLKIEKPRLRGYKTSKGILENHLKPFFNNRTLSSITTSDVNRWQSIQLEASYSPSSVKRQRNVLSSILNQALRDQYVDINPCANASSLRIPETQPRFLTGEEIVLFLAKAEEQAEWLPDYILWSIHSGMRKGEIRDLQWDNVIPWDGNYLIRFRTGKTHKIRDISCNLTMNNILERQRDRQKENDDRVFPISQTTLKRKWKAAREEANIPDVTTRHMRITSATYAVASGVDLKTLSGRLGHSDLTMLEKHYAGLVDTNAVEASKKLEQKLQSVMQT